MRSRRLNRLWMVPIIVGALAAWAGAGETCETRDEPLGGGYAYVAPPQADQEILDPIASTPHRETRSQGAETSGGPLSAVLIVDSPLFVIDPNDGVLTLIEAVEQAAADGGPTTIMFDPQTFPPDAPETIFTDRRLIVSDPGDAIDGLDAGVVLRPAAGAQDDGYGVQLETTDARVSNLTLEAYRFGAVRAMSGSTGLIENVRIRDTFDPLGRGVYVRAGASITMRSVHVTDVPNDGIGVTGATAVVEDCTVERAGDDGIAAWGSDLTVRRCTLVDCGDKAMSFSGDANAPPGTLTLSSVENTWSGTTLMLGDNEIRPLDASGDLWVHPASTVVSETPVDLGNQPPPPLDDAQPVDLYLPFDAGKVSLVTQGINGWRTHFRRVAFDMRLWDRIGTPVRACAPGRVIRVFDNTPGPGSSRPSNYVWIDHGFGIIGAYRHLQLGSLRVTPGQLVSRYDVIGDGGMSGHTTGPHLHVEFFKRFQNSVWPWNVCFSDVPPDPCGIPTAENEYTSGNSPAPPDQFVDSVMAADVFTDPGDPLVDGDEFVIELSDSLPMAYFHTQQRYMFRGTVPADVKAVRLWIKDYTTRDTVASVEGLVFQGRFAVGFELPDNLAGAYRVGLDGTVDETAWSFYFKRTLPIIVVGPTGLAETPPDLVAPQWDPAEDFDGDGITNGEDPWVDVTVDSPLWEDETDQTTTLRDAVTIANDDWRPTYIRFDPAVFPADAPVVIPFQRNLDVGNDGDVIDATGAGVIAEYVGPATRTSGAFAFRGIGSTIKNITLRGFPGNVVRVGSLSTALLEDMTVMATGRRAFRGSWSSQAELRRSTLIGAPGIEFSTCWVDEEASIVLEDVVIRQGRAGLFVGARSTAHVTRVDISETAEAPVQLMTGSRSWFEDVTTIGNPNFENVLTERFVRMNFFRSTLTGGRSGMVLLGGDRANLRETLIEGITGDDGIALFENARLTIENSAIENTARHGLAINDTSTVMTCDGRIFQEEDATYLGTNRISGWGGGGSGEAILQAGGTIVGGDCQFGDPDRDADIDLDDFDAAYECITGPNGGPMGRGCTIFDFDLDDDVDMQDIAALFVAFTGPGE